MRDSTLASALALARALLIACTSTGMGFGSAPAGGNEAKFTWKDSGAVSRRRNTP
jgi:hypothetical protein